MVKKLFCTPKVGITIGDFLCILILSIFLFLILGCSSTPKEKFKVGGFKHSLSTGMSFDYQFQITRSVKKELYTDVFPMEFNKPLPNNTVALVCVLLVKNPYRLDYTVRENVDVIVLETGKPFPLKNKTLRYTQRLPEELLAVDLPLYSEFEADVIFSIDILDSEDKVIYSTKKAKYKLGVK